MFKYPWTLEFYFYSILYESKSVPHRLRSTKQEYVFIFYLRLFEVETGVLKNILTLKSNFINQ